MEKLKAFIRLKPVLFCIILGLVNPILHLLLNLPLALLPKATLSSFISETWDLMWPILLALLLGYGFIFRLKGFFKSLKAGMPLLLFFSFILYVTCKDAIVNPETQWQELPVILVGIITMIGVGIREEVIYRGIIGSTLALKLGKTDKGLWQAVLLAAFLFGIMHFANILAGARLSGLISQIISAASQGALFMAIYLRGGNLWVPVFIHAVIDSAGLFESTFIVSSISMTDQISRLGFSGLYIMIPLQLGLTLFLLRKKKRAAILERLEQLRIELQG